MSNGYRHCIQVSARAQIQHTFNYLCINVKLCLLRVGIMLPDNELFMIKITVLTPGDWELTVFAKYFHCQSIVVL